MVDCVFMVDGPSINHRQKAINHKSWLMGCLREWLMVGLNIVECGFHTQDLSVWGSQIRSRQARWEAVHQP